MNLILLNSASSICLPVLPVQTHGGNNTFPLAKGQSPFTKGLSCALLEGAVFASIATSPATAAADHGCCLLMGTPLWPGTTSAPFPAHRLVSDPPDTKNIFLSPLLHKYQPFSKTGLCSSLRVKDFLKLLGVKCAFTSRKPFQPYVVMSSLPYHNRIPH